MQYTEILGLVFSLNEFFPYISSSFTSKTNMDESIYGMNLVIFTHHNEKKSGVQGCILPPCPLGHGQGGFFVQKKN